MTKNTLVVIGWLGMRQCYLNIPREEAIRRYCAARDDDPANIENNPEGLVDEFEFTDTFSAYDAYSSDPA